MTKNRCFQIIRSPQISLNQLSVKILDLCQSFLRFIVRLFQIGTTLFIAFLLTATTQAEDELRESADSFFIRQGIFQVDTENGDQILLNEKKIDPYAAANLRKLFKFIQSQNTVELMDPKKIEVIYDNAFYNRVRSFAVNEAYQSTTTRSQIPNNLQEYLEFEKMKMQTFLNQKRTQVQQVDFKTAQKSKLDVKGTTLANENLIIYGLTEPLLAKINQVLNKYIKRYEMEKIGLYIYGSRVMPRGEVIRQNPEAHSHWGIYDDGVSKTSIRTAGITSLSDLDLIITVYEPVRKNEEVFAIAMEIQKELNQSIKNFPISLWITPSRSADKDVAFKKFVRARKGFASDFQIIDSKTLAMPKSCAWLLM